MQTFVSLEIATLSENLQHMRTCTHTHIDIYTFVGFDSLFFISLDFKKPNSLSPLKVGPFILRSRLPHIQAFALLSIAKEQKIHLNKAFTQKCECL